jgi:hypothetical protein
MDISSGQIRLLQTALSGVMRVRPATDRKSLSGLAAQAFSTREGVLTALLEQCCGRMAETWLVGRREHNWPDWLDDWLVGLCGWPGWPIDWPNDQEEAPGVECGASSIQELPG